MPLEDALITRAQRTATVSERLASLMSSAASYERTTLEVGCGHGHFLAAYAAAHPRELCIGIDLLRDRLERASRKSDRANLPNIAWIQAEATLFIEAMPMGMRLDRIWLLFSDPWPKRRHWKHRVAQPAFMSALALRAPKGAEFCFRTDYEPYFHYAHQVITDHPCWALPADVTSRPWPFEEETVFQSRAEQFYSLIALRTAEPVPEKPPLPPVPDAVELPEHR